MAKWEKLSEVAARMDPAVMAKNKIMKLELIEETPGVLWSVRNGGAVFLVVRYGDCYQAHAVADGGIEFLGQAPASAWATLELIRAKIEGR